MSESDQVVLRSAANPTIRRLVRMRDSNRARRKAGRVLVDGWRETAQALDAGLELLDVFVPEQSKPEDDGGWEAEREQVIRQLPKQQVQQVSESLMSKISFGQSSRGVVAEFLPPQRSLANLNLDQKSTPLVLILDQIEKPGNVGAVFRTADAAGIDAVVICGNDDLFNPNTIRSSLGCVFHVPSAAASEAEIQSFLSSAGIRILAARVESSTELWTTDLRGPLAIVLGSEAGGLGQRWQQCADQAIPGIRIPMAGRVDSLNVSVTAAVIGFEAIRQRRI